MDVKEDTEEKSTKKLTFFNELRRQIYGFDKITFIVIIFNLTMSLIFFIVRHYFSNSPIFKVDHAAFLYAAIQMGEASIPNYHSIMGYVISFYCGFSLEFYPLGFHFIIVLVHYLGFSYVNAYKILIFLLINTIGIFPYWASIKLKRTRIEGLIGSIWIWIGFNSYWGSTIDNGVIATTSASILTMYFFISTLTLDFNLIPEDYNNNNNKNNKKININNSFKNNKNNQALSNGILSRKGIKSIILLFFIAFINYMATIFIAIIVVADIILNFIKEKKITNQIRNEIKFFAGISIFAILLYCFWLIPTLMYVFELNLVPGNLYTFQRAISQNIIYLSRNWIPMLGIILITFYLTSKQNKTTQIPRFIYFILFVSLFIVFIVPFFFIPLFSGDNAYKYLIFFEFSSALLVGPFAVSIRKQIKLYQALRGNKHKGALFKKTSNYLKFGAIIGFLLCFNLFNIPNPQNTFRFMLYGENINEKGEIIYLPMNHTTFDPEIEFIINWFKENTTRDSRILVQNSGEESNFVYNNGHTIGYLMYLTNRLFATGFSQILFFKYQDQTNFLEDNLYGKFIRKWSLAEISERFDYYNVEYILIWSEFSKITFNYYAEASDDFEKVLNTSRFELYRYNKCPRSYIMGLNSSYYNDVQLDEGHLQFTLNKVPENYNLTITFHNHRNWHVYINGKHVEKRENQDGFIQFNIPKEIIDDIENSQNENNSIITIELRWENHPFEIIGDIISALVAIYLFYLFFKHPTREKESILKNIESSSQTF